MRMNYKRIMAAGMVFVMLCTGTGGVPAYGAEATVDVDETMYVNLDYYGRLDKIKGSGPQWTDRVYGLRYLWGCD